MAVMSVIGASRSLALAVLLLSLTAGLGHAEDTFLVLVNAANAGTQIRRETVAAAFLKKVTRWGDGSAISPVDQSATSSVRKDFSEAVLKQPVASVQNYWMQLIHAGRGAPPPVKNSDADVAAYVAKEAGGIGYVSAGFAPPGGTKVLRLID